jgi:hypothetical protein
VETADQQPYVQIWAAPRYQPSDEVKLHKFLVSFISILSVTYCMVSDVRSEAAWPSLAWEERPWVPKISPDLVSASVRKRHGGPYRSAIVPTIADLSPRLPGKVASVAEEASVEIARFDAELNRPYDC